MTLYYLVIRYGLKMLSEGGILIRIGSDIITLSTIIAIMIFVTLLIYAMLGSRRYVKIVLSFLLITTSIAHYNILVYLLQYLKISVSIYPFIIIESAQQGSVLYPDIGQISLLTLVIMWRSKVREYLLKIYHYVRGLKVDRENRANTTP